MCNDRQLAEIGRKPTGARLLTLKTGDALQYYSTTCVQFQCTLHLTAKNIYFRNIRQPADVYEYVKLT